MLKQCMRCWQVVFATETLAAGINMPARTTVISTLSRRRDTAHSALLHNELLQMAGRAGRRGFDTAGQAPAHWVRRVLTQGLAGLVHLLMLHAVVSLSWEDAFGGYGENKEAAGS